MQVGNSNWKKLKEEISRLKVLQVCNGSKENVDATFRSIATLMQKIEAEDKKSQPAIIRS